MGRTRSEPALAQSGEKLRTNNIAMIVPQRFIALDLPFLRKCMGGICTMADQRGYDLMLCYSPIPSTRSCSGSWPTTRWTA